MAESAKRRRRRNAKHRSAGAVPDPAAPLAARAAGLRYVNDGDPGIRRRPTRSGFRYRDPAGRSVHDTATLARIRRLAIPPAWTDVWICPDASGHIQATGRDARRRKQYRYHPDWTEIRDQQKFSRLLALAHVLPRLRRRVARDMARPGLGRDKVLATMVRLLEETLARVGNETYARENGSFGLSTMRDRHVSAARGRLQFEFKGKSGVSHRIELRDPALAAIVRRVQELPGQELFQYLDEHGRPQDVKSEDVNAYLRRIAGAEFSAKDIRTWAGTVLATAALCSIGRSSSRRETRRNITRAVTGVARQLGNTPAVCRKAYIHPLVLADYAEGRIPSIVGLQSRRMLGSARGGLSRPEQAVVELLQRRRPPPPTLLTSLRRSVARTRRRGARGSAGGARAATRSPARKSRS